MTYEVRSEEGLEAVFTTELDAENYVAQLLRELAVFAWVVRKSV